MPSHQSKSVQFVGSFLGSVMIAYWLAKRDEGEKKIESQIYSAIGTASGLFVGNKLTERADQ